MILCANPRAQYLAHRAEIDAAITRVLLSGRYILGEEVTAFESEFAAYVGAECGVGVGSGTEALHLALRACGVNAGDEVITVSHTAVATVSAIELCGATPVLVDIDPESFTMDPECLEPRLSARTKAVVVVHLYGQAAELEVIIGFARRHNLRVVEDCAQAHGARYRDRPVGSWGDVGCFSFYPTKNLGALGDGGMLVTSDRELAARARRLREYGWGERYVSELPGWNSRLDAIQAAVLRAKLSHLESDNAARRDRARTYEGGLRDLSLVAPREAPGRAHVYHLYVVRSPQRDALKAHLEGAGVAALIHYPVPVHLQPAYRGRLPGANDLDETERAAREVLSLPMYPELTEQEQGVVITAVRAFRG